MARAGRTGARVAALALLTAAEPAVRTAAATTAAYCLRHEAPGHDRAALVQTVTETAAVSPGPAERAAVARLLVLLDEPPDRFLNDPHPGVRACAALAPGLAHDPRATKALVTALKDPLEADRWFDRHLPGQEGRLHFDLALTLADRARPRRGPARRAGPRRAVLHPCPPRRPHPVRHAGPPGTPHRAHCPDTGPTQLPGSPPGPPERALRRGALPPSAGRIGRARGRFRVVL